ncbi:MAG: hypothetical protein V2B18_12035 [Pseudomonadota bacterium]
MMSPFLCPRHRRINLNQYELPWPWNKTVGIREWLRARDIMHETAWLSVLACAVMAIGCGAILLMVLWR